MIDKLDNLRKIKVKAFMMKLYDYWRSSASFRVRIALNLKGLEYEQCPIHLVKDGGQQHSTTYSQINPQNLVPSLVVGDKTLIQSMAILEYLEEVYPNPSLLPQEPSSRAEVRAMCNVIANDTHPIQNLRVLQQLKINGFDQEQVQRWAAHWIELGFGALEKMLNERPQSKYFYGDDVTMADVVIAPQLVNAIRFGADLQNTPRVVETIERLMQLPEFESAKPSNQPDAE